MNKTKRVLIIIAIILDFLSVAGYIAAIIANFSLPPVDRVLDVVTTVYLIIDIIVFVAVAVMLILCVKNGGQNFRSHNVLYTTAVILQICFATLSLASILLFISLFISDLVWVKPHDDVYFGPEQNGTVHNDNNSDEKRKKIEELRKLRDDGLITDEEFKEQMFKLL